VVGVDNFHSYYDRSAKEYALELTKKVSLERFTFVEADIRDKEAMSQVFEAHSIDKIIHLAAMAGVPYSVKDPHLYMDVNIIGTTVLADLAVSHKLQNFVFASSSSVYGNRTDVPFRETDDVNNPVSPYAASKRMGEILLNTYHHLYHIPVSCLRFFTVYGPLQRPYGMVIQRFMKQIDHDQPVTIYGDGSMGRDYTYIDDIISGIVAVLDANLPYEIFNLGNSSPVSVSGIVDALELVMQKQAQRQYLEAPDTEVSITYADTSKAQSMLGYRPKTAFPEGLAKQWEAYQKMPQWYKDLPW
jgi:UDP-glucuronate 4-epimerase